MTTFLCGLSNMMGIADGNNWILKIIGSILFINDVINFDATMP